MGDNGISYSFPLVSIIIPVYNVEKYLKKCIDSVLTQTYLNLEVLLINDGSLDNCGEICDYYKSIDKRVKVIHKKNGGLSDARNCGLEICTGDYIAFIDSDDFISEYYIETMIKAIMENDCQMAALAASTPFYDGQEVLSDVLTSNYDLEIYSGTDALRLMLYQNIATGAPFKICKKDIFNTIRFPKGYLYEDVATTYKEFFYADKVAVVRGDFYAYRKRNDSITHQKFNHRKMIVVNIREQLLMDKDIERNGLINAATARTFQMIFNVFLQTPTNDRKSMKSLWKCIRKDRKVILHDKSRLMKKKNILGALVSYLGMNITHTMGNKILRH